MTTQLIESRELEKYIPEGSKVEVIGTGLYDGKSYREIKIVNYSLNFTLFLRVFELNKGGIQLPMNIQFQG